MPQITSPPTQISKSPGDIAVEFNGLAPAAIGSVVTKAAPASHAHPVNSLGRAVTGFGVAAHFGLSSYGAGGQKAGMIMGTSDPIPAMSQWCIEWFGNTGPLGGHAFQDSLCVGWLGAFQNNGGPNFYYTGTSMAMPSDLIGASNNGTAASAGQLTNGGFPGGQGANFPLMMGLPGWQHYAITSDGKTMRMFIAGALVASIPAPAFAGGPVGMTTQVGESGDTLADEFRVSSVPRYIANFVPPAVPFIPDEATVLLWHFDDIPLGTEIAQAFDTSGQFFYQFLGLSADATGNGHAASFFPGASQGTGGNNVGIFGGVVSTITTGSGVGTAYLVNSVQGQRGDLVLTDTSGNPIANPVPQANGTTELQMTAPGPLAETYEQEITATTPVTVLAYTPVASGLFEIGVYFRVVTAATNVTVVATSTDAGGAQTFTMLALTAEPVGSYVVVPIKVACVAGDAISVVVTAGTANQVYVTSDISRG